MACEPQTGIWNMESIDISRKFWIGAWLKSRWKCPRGMYGSLVRRRQCQRSRRDFKGYDDRFESIRLPRMELWSVSRTDGFLWRFYCKCCQCGIAGRSRCFRSGQRYEGDPAVTRAAAGGQPKGIRCADRCRTGADETDGCRTSCYGSRTKDSCRKESERETGGRSRTLHRSCRSK